MPRYLAAKSVEHAAHLDWARRQLALFREQNLPHLRLLDRLDAQLAEDAQTLRQIEISIGLPGMRWVAEKACYTLHASLRDLSENYIAGLLQQGPEELRWRELLLDAAHRVGLTWIHDILVRLDRDLSIIPSHHRDHSIPIFFAPPSQHQSVLSLPGIFHEFGHCVVSRFRAIAFSLKETVAHHFDAERLKLGPMLPAQRKGRLQQIDDAAVFWTEHRLVEIFCDVFATYTCGCVNILSMVDLARASAMDPHSVEYDYPPHATRIAASLHALEPQQQKSVIVAEVWGDWQKMAQILPTTNEYHAYCPVALVEKLAARSVELIGVYLPATACNTALPYNIDEALAQPVSADLLASTATGLAILWHSPQQFHVWKAGFRNVLGFE